MQSQSHIVVNKEGRVTAYVGEDSTNLCRAITLKHALKLYAKCGLIPTRGVTITVMLRIAKEYTGKNYKRGQAMQAAEDVGVWIETMRAALPVVEEN